MTHADSARGGSGRAAAAGVVLGLLAVAVVSPPGEAASRPTVIAHRGDRAAAPENTGAAFRSALARGANAIEMDIRFSRTAYPVVMHDATLDRTTNCAGPVSARSRTELRRCDAGRWFGARFRGERVPTLQMALRTVSARSDSAKVLLHVKVLPDAKRAGRVMDAVKRYGMRKRTIVIADTPSILSRMRAAGFSELGLVFSSPSGWTKRYEYMIPYDTPLDPVGVAATHRRGGKVWPVGGHPTPLATLLGLTNIDGILVDHLSALVKVPALPKVEVPQLPVVPATPAGAEAPTVMNDADVVGENDVIGED
jgi:glycerophosphoryl diester phosphodiesterase